MAEPLRIRHLLHEMIMVYLRPYWMLHIPLAVTVVLAVIMEVCLPLTIRFMIDHGLIPHDQGNLIKVTVILVLIVAGGMAGRHLMALISAYMHKELTTDLRIELIRLIQRLPMSFFDSAPPAYFSPLYDTELGILIVLARDLFARGIYTVLQFVVVIGTLTVLGWQLALVVIVILPLMLWPILRQAQPVIGAIDRLRTTMEAVVSAAQDHVATLALTRAFGQEEAVTSRFVENPIGRKGPRARLSGLVDARRTMLTPHFLQQTMTVAIDHIGSAITLTVVCVGAWLTFAGTMTLGTLSAFLLLLPVVMKTFGVLSRYVQDLGRGCLSLERLERVKRVGAANADLGGTVNLPVPAQEIRFEAVTFRYGDGPVLLRDVNLTLPIHQSVAIVGRSGSGKSTFFKLILGLYQPASGRVTIDDYDVRRMAPGSPGSRIGTVLQQSVLFNATIRANICFARPDATDEEMHDAARMADIHEFILSLPHGYDSPAGEGGRRLSEGQKQRIALARAILPNPTILLLDEVTASLDPATESAINTTIQKLAKVRTVILVTHRLAAASFVDRMVVVDQGEVKEQGHHETLLARKGLYAQLWQMQAGFVVSDDGHHAEVSGERLQAIPLLRDVEMAKLNELARRFTSRFYDTDEFLCEEGEAGDKFFIIVRGTVSVSAVGSGGQTVRLADLQDGDYFGEVEMLNRGKRATTVRAKTPCLVLTLSTEHFLGMLDEISSLNKIVTQMALDRSLSTICGVGRRRRDHVVWQELMTIDTIASHTSGR